MATEKIKVYIYTRVSTAMQINGYSLDAQKARMKAYAISMIIRSLASTKMLESPANPLRGEHLSAG